jgi:hypothetical protein
MKIRTRKIRFASGVNYEATLAAVRAFSENACTAPIRPAMVAVRKDKTKFVNRKS